MQSKWQIKTVRMAWTRRWKLRCSKYRGTRFYHTNIVRETLQVALMVEIGRLELQWKVGVQMYNITIRWVICILNLKQAFFFKVFYSKTLKKIFSKASLWIHKTLTHSSIDYGLSHQNFEICMDYKNCENPFQENAPQQKLVSFIVRFCHCRRLDQAQFLRFCVIKNAHLFLSIWLFFYVGDQNDEHIESIDGETPELGRFKLSFSAATNSVKKSFLGNYLIFLGGLALFNQLSCSSRGHELCSSYGRCCLRWHR